MDATKSIIELCEVAALMSAAKVARELSDGSDDDDEIKISCPEGCHIKEMLEYLDGMVLDIQSIHKQLSNQEERLKLLENKLGIVRAGEDGDGKTTKTFFRTK